MNQESRKKELKKKSKKNQIVNLSVKVRAVYLRRGLVSLDLNRIARGTNVRAGFGETSSLHINTPLQH